jgi:hypothetical protein
MSEHARTSEQRLVLSIVLAAGTGCADGGIDASASMTPPSGATEGVEGTEGTEAAATSEETGEDLEEPRIGAFVRVSGAVEEEHTCELPECIVDFGAMRIYHDPAWYTDYWSLSIEGASFAVMIVSDALPFPVEPPPTGTHEIGYEAGSTWYAGYSTPQPPLWERATGTFTLTTSTEDRVEGSFEFSAVQLVAQEPSAMITVEGTFWAERDR